MALKWPGDSGVGASWHVEPGMRRTLDERARRVELVFLLGEGGSMATTSPLRASVMQNVHAVGEENRLVCNGHGASFLSY